MKRLAILALALASCSEVAPTSTGDAQVAAFDGAGASDRAAREAHGERLATVLACNSCHGADLTGGDYGEDADGGFIFAPNLTRALPHLSNWQLRRLLGEGIHPKRARFYYMPAKTLQRLSRDDMGSLVAYLRSLEPTGREWPAPDEGESTLALVEMGILETSNDRVQAYRVHRPPEIAGAPVQGRYIASVTCAECHGPALDGGLASAPSLQSALGRYDEAQLRALLAGHGKGELMKLVASRNLSALTDAERDALVAYLLALGRE